VGVPIARRNLFESKARVFVSTGGVALAMLLVLALDGVFAGAMRGVTAYIDATPFDVIVSQEGVRNLHMTSSQFPLYEVDRLRSVPGVAEADPILFTTAFLVTGDRRSLVYLIGYQPGKLGGPASGGSAPETLGTGEIVIDAQIAGEMGLRVGDTVSVVGRDFTIAGFVSGTVSVTNSVAYIRFDDFQAAAGLVGTASFGLIRVRPGIDPASVEPRVQQRVSDLTVQTKAEFANSERRIISDMSTDILRVMSLVGFLIGLAVVGLTVYTSTLAKLKEYGVLKALGASGSRLFGIVLGQAVMSAALGLAVAVAAAVGASAALSLAHAGLRIVIETSSVGRVALASTAIALLASAAPIVRVWRIEPADVFRR
jgi:putative ABC transport system permease protein